MLISDYTIEGKHISELTKGSYYRVIVKCEICGYERSTAYQNYYNSQLKKNNDGTTHCKSCASKINGIKKQGQPAWSKGKTFPERQGKNSPTWKGGRFKSKDGWIIAIQGKSGIKEHRYIMSQHIGRDLERSEEIHHINIDKFDNNINNLCILTSSEHAKLHGSFEKLIQKLLQLEIVKFDNIEKQYYVAHDKSRELLEHPVEDNQQPSLMK